MNFHHLGIIVSDIKQASKNLKAIIPIKKKTKIITDKSWKVKILFLIDNNKVTYEIIEPLGKSSPIYNALKKNINILNHIAYESINFEKDCKKLIKQGLVPLTKAMGAVAFKNKKVIFFYTKEKFILELIEK
jgi:hypothetical protein